MDELPFYKAENLIELFISDEDASAREFELALELIHFLNDDPSLEYSEEQRNSFKIEILVRSILADNWQQLYHEDYPETKLDKTKFFQSVYSMIKNGESLDAIGEMKESLINHELTQHLKYNQRFPMLIETCFEMLDS